MKKGKNRCKQLVTLSLAAALVMNTTDFPVLTVAADVNSEIASVVNEKEENEVVSENVINDANQNESAETISFEEYFDMAPMETAASSIEAFSLLDGTVTLKDTNEVNWIDRLDLTNATEIQDFYNTLVEASDNDGIDDFLIEDTYFTGTNNIEIATVTGHADTSDAVREAMSDVLSKYAPYVQAAYDAFDRDHPEVFWLSGNTKCSVATNARLNSKGGYDYTITINFTAKRDDFDIRATDYQSQEAIQTTIETINTRVDALVSEVTEKGIWDKLAYFNEQLTKTNQYNTSSDLTSIGHDCRECTSALEGRIGTYGPVCESYARAFKVLCDKVDIPCVLVDGQAKSSSSSSGEAHMWNYVKVAGSWYAVDVTWNDPKGGSSGAESGIENEKWFLVGSDTTINSMTFIASHPIGNQASQNGVQFTNGPILSTEKCDKSVLENCVHEAGEILYTGNGECEPTCANIGLGHKECTICGETMENGIIVPTLDHTGGSATCSKKAVCSVCEQEYGEVDSGNHGETEVRGEVAATCQTAGYAGDTYCKDCGEKLASGTEISALGHIGGSATCNKKALCSVCQQEYGTADSSKHGQTELRGQVTATCETAGYTGDAYCKDCGVKLATGTQIPAIGHSYISAVTVESTIETEGEITYTCTTCGATRKEAIAKLPVSKGTVISDQTTKASYKVTQTGEKNGTVEYINSTDKNVKTITIPATVTINGIKYKVTSIAKNAFKNNKKLTKVTIGSNVKTIDANAFYGCTKLKTVTIGKNVTTIGSKAFYKCTALSNITIPSKVTKIESNAFYGCKKLKSITIKATKLTTKTVGKNAFKGMYTKATIKVPKSKYKSYISLLKARGVSKTAKFK